jgi:hypothetical protein
MSSTDQQKEPEFTEGVCGDGAAILMNGQQLAIPEILERLRKGAEAERIVKSRQRRNLEAIEYLRSCGDSYKQK